MGGSRRSRRSFVIKSFENGGFQVNNNIYYNIYYYYRYFSKNPKSLMTNDLHDLRDHFQKN